ncbi:hypothetical protein EDEG_02976 [Edhazardia aedis USNM 41457]|uniref:Uncharacterized protein n=1 Tax=Edhazardia aedis (strain USNM 41457) TaxID=1003232 RepID=J8ZSJ5_EDHAE|nr:hypothetical protein EDEG_02976 [Edhazardia aedis USNM 41457]|eukprot:EJW02618.1 hypothetical protein EDEG_02976 [Edhazardia aedis USNM 41457]
MKDRYNAKKSSIYIQLSKTNRENIKNHNLTNFISKYYSNFLTECAIQKNILNVKEKKEGATYIFLIEGTNQLYKFIVLITLFLSKSKNRKTFKCITNLMVFCILKIYIGTFM